MKHPIASTSYDDFALDYVEAAEDYISEPESLDDVPLLQRVRLGQTADPPTKNMEYLSNIVWKYGNRIHRSQVMVVLKRQMLFMKNQDLLVIH